MGKKDKKEKKDKKHKKEKKRKRSRSPSPSSSSSSSSSESDSIDRRKRKAEKLAQKLAQRLSKDQRSLAGYTNETNPFGDDKLNQRFVWHKKIEKQILDGDDARNFSLAEIRKQDEERLKEIEKVKERRKQREAEREQMQAEKELMERERALVDAAELEKKEEEFHLAQARMRAEIRLREGRPKPIDLLARNVACSSFHAFDFRLDPVALFDNLTGPELAELEFDLRSLQDLERGDKEHFEFWSNLVTVCRQELIEVRKREAEDRARLLGRELPPEAEEQGLHRSLDRDVQEMFSGKSYAELATVEEEVKDTLRRGGAGTDSEYWEAVLKRLRVWKAKARVGEIHGAIRERFVRDRREAGEEPPEEPEAGSEEEEEEEGAVGEGGAAAAAAGGKEWDYPARAGSPTRTVAGIAEESDGRFSPARVPMAEDAASALTEVIDEEEDRRQIAARRREVREAEQRRFGTAARLAEAELGPSDGGRTFRAMTRQEHVPAMAGGGLLANLAPRPADADEEERKMRALASQMMGDGAGAEVAFAGEVPLESQVYWWHDKYRPRKPKYFNRVHTGYDWNKYNQTHYDHDNPPPKVVQGYKFNIFYPDLIDKAQAPRYEILPDGSPHGETCILRFIAGAPYEDIAFKIVCKPWEYAPKRGFRCSFERGVLHLYFNFERPRYRR